MCPDLLFSSSLKEMSGGCQFYLLLQIKSKENKTNTTLSISCAHTLQFPFLSFSCGKAAWRNCPFWVSLPYHPLSAFWLQQLISAPSTPHFKVTEFLWVLRTYSTPFCFYLTFENELSTCSFFFEPSLPCPCELQFLLLLFCLVLPFTPPHLQALSLLISCCTCCSNVSDALEVFIRFPPLLFFPSHSVNFSVKPESLPQPQLPKHASIYRLSFEITNYLPVWFRGTSVSIH